MGIERYSAWAEIAGPVGIGNAYAELLAGAADPVSVKSITLTTASAVGGEVALVHSSAIGTGAATGIFTGIAHRTVATAATGTARLQIAWTSSGVTPTGYVSGLKHEVMPVATGQSRTLWDSSRDGELIIEPTKSILLINHASGIQGGGMHINFTWQEGRL